MIIFEILIIFLCPKTTFDEEIKPMMSGGSIYHLTR
jgi:hypothetical protein